MNTPAKLTLAVIALLVVAAGAWILLRGLPVGRALGPVDGHELPPTDLERVAVGNAAPDFSLRALSGDVVTLSEFRGQQNVLLVFYRGHW